jgi:HKD family nuclease
MKLITKSSELESEFKRLIKKYKNFYWATAWAGVSSTLFSELVSKQTRISKIVVGLHFYQTHPDFIEQFLDHDGVRFIKQPSGTFHPKLYLFWNSDKVWELLIGSANFTNEAFTRNTEASTLISYNDDTGAAVLEDAVKLIDQCWDEGQKFNKDELENYRIAWRNLRPKINSLAGKYGGSRKKSKPIYEVAIASLSWKGFIRKVRLETHTQTKNRLGLLTICKELFESVYHFNQLSEDERKFIAGIPNRLETDDEIDWGWFGSMKGAGIFKNKIRMNDTNISKALDQIPFTGQVTKAHYDRFIGFYSKACPGNYIATASRLLAMKRPDSFVCLDSKNNSSLCRDFGIQVSGMTYERYWSDITERIFDSEWWLNPAPTTSVERQISDSRAAFLDALYYDRG